MATGTALPEPQRGVKPEKSPDATNVRYRVGPLVDNVGNKITEGVLMAEELNMHFSSVFTREYTSSLPALES